MARNLETAPGVHSTTKSACVLATKNIQIFEIAETIEWFFNRMCDGRMLVSNIYCVRVHDQIVTVGFQPAIVWNTGKRLIIGDPNSYFFEERKRTPIISKLWDEYHIPFRVASGIGLKWAAKNSGTLQISRSAFAAAHGEPADNNQAICEIYQRNIRKADIAKQIRKEVVYVFFGAACAVFVGLGLMFLRDTRESVLDAVCDISGGILVALGMSAGVNWAFILLVVHSAGWSWTR